MMTRSPPLQPASADDGSRLEDLVELIERLIDVVAEENIALAMGLPASQSQHTAIKLELSGLFEAWVKESRAQEHVAWHFRSPVAGAGTHSARTAQRRDGRECYPPARRDRGRPAPHRRRDGRDSGADIRQRALRRQWSHQFAVGILRTQRADLNRAVI